MKKRNNLKAAALAGGILMSSALVPGSAEAEYLRPQPDSGLCKTAFHDREWEESTFLDGLDFCAAENIPPCVYGPPPDETDFLPEDNSAETVYGPPPEESSPQFKQDESESSNFQPGGNIPETVYGPPPEESSPQFKQDESESSDFQPGGNIPETVYGPPSLFFLNRFLDWISGLFG